MIRYVFTFWLPYLVSIGFAQQAVRTWTDKDARTFEGTYISQSTESVEIRRAADNKLFKVNKELLSPEDISFLVRQADLETQKALLEPFDISFLAARKKADQADLPLCVFYRYKMDAEIFGECMAKMVTNEHFQKISGSRAIIAIISNQDEDVERRSATFLLRTENACLMFYDPGFQDFNRRQSFRLSKTDSPETKATELVASVEEGVTRCEDEKARRNEMLSKLKK